MPAIGKIYCTRRDLEQIRHDCQSSLEIDDATMLLWTPLEARTYFSSGGTVMPDAAVLTTRHVDDAIPKRKGLSPNEEETLLSCCCCCCDWLIMMHLEKKRARRKAAAQQHEQQQLEVAPGEIQIMQRCG